MDDIRIPLIGEKAPSFRAMTTNGKINFPDDFSGKWVILFSHPADFTPVCTTEFMRFAIMEKEFKEINTELIGLSIDSLSSHIAWLRSIENMEYGDYKGQKVNFPVIADISMKVSKLYGMLHPSAANTQTVRAVFIIDPNAIVRTILFYPASTGRNFEEIKRTLMSLQKVDEQNIATPCNWTPGDDVIIHLPESKKEADAIAEKAKSDEYNSLDWYLTFKKDK
ncbi:MAG: peroxiredoxin [Fusobacterium sp. JB021]|nr:peroxiredoxin [Fusobacterium sp. JB021]MDP0506871.1 peroxiredoxin [Fusobacterium sp. JB019]